ncbi:unnamed protein product, partial [Meganyctiphanes norvegica]
TTNPPPLTTDTTTLTTSNPPPRTTDDTNIACYQCMGCSSLDPSTPVISDANYQSCVTTVFLSDSNVIRGATYDQHPDGECIQTTEILSCWCTSSLCNNNQI